MGRNRTRISRGLIAALAVVLVLGLIFYFHNSNKTNASQTKPAEAAAPAKTSVAIAPAKPSTQPAIQIGTAPTTPTSVPPAQPGVSVTQTPTISVGGPTTKPVANAALSQQPAAPKVATPIAISSNKPLVDGKARMDANDLLGARRVLNTALSTGLPDADTASAKAMLAEISKTVVFSSKRFADDEFGGSYSVQSGESLQKIARQHDVTWELLCRLNGLSDPKRLRAGATIKVLKGPMHAVVSKSKFTMDIYFGAPGGAGSMYVTTFGVGLGRDDSTPTGKWLVEPQRKIKNPVYYSPRGEGIIDADDPKNPLGEYWLGLTGVDGHAVGKMSYGIHGTVDPESIGKQASMGCIRMRNEDVAQVFELLVEGKSTVVVQD